MREEPDPILWKTAPGFDSWSTDEFEVHLSQGRVIKERPKKRLLEVDSEGKTYLVKVYRGDGGFRRLPSGAKAEHEFHMSLRLVEAGIPTVPLIALGDRPEEGLVVMEKLEGWTDLQKILLDPDRLPAEIRDRIRCYGRFARRLHDAGIWQQDFNPTNILASTTAGEHELKLIDFERMKWKRSLSTGERYRSLAKMNRIPRLSRTDRMRFLRAYLGGGGRPVSGSRPGNPGPVPEQGLGRRAEDGAVMLARGKTIWRILYRDREDLFPEGGPDVHPAGAILRERGGSLRTRMGGIQTDSGAGGAPDLERDSSKLDGYRGSTRGGRGGFLHR